MDDALGEKLSKPMREGPIETLTLTENAQPALMQAVSLAVARTLEKAFGVPIEMSFVAGHSLGEHSAATAAGALTLGDTARLLALRAGHMQRAVPVGEGRDGGADHDLEERRGAGGGRRGGQRRGRRHCAVANDNNAGNVVISGLWWRRSERAIEKRRGGARLQAIPVNVSAPFHCPLMQPAADEMAEALAAITIVAPRTFLVANVTARPTNDPEVIRRQLVEQVTGRVRWRESIEWMAGEGGVTRFAELGAGKVLTGMVKRIAPDAEALGLNAPADLEAFAGSL